MQFDNAWRLRLIKIAARVVELKKANQNPPAVGAPPIRRSSASSSTACRGLVTLKNRGMVPPPLFLPSNP